MRHRCNPTCCRWGRRVGRRGLGRHASRDPSMRSSLGVFLVDELAVFDEPVFGLESDSAPWACVRPVGFFSWLASATVFGRRASGLLGTLFREFLSRARSRASVYKRWWARRKPDVTRL